MLGTPLFTTSTTSFAPRRSARFPSFASDLNPVAVMPSEYVPAAASSSRRDASKISSLADSTNSLPAHQNGTLNSANNAPPLAGPSLSTSPRTRSKRRQTSP